MTRAEIELQIMLDIKFTFEIHSDSSSHCNGYRSLLEKIKEKKKEISKNEHFPMTEFMSEHCTICGKPIDEHFKK